MKRLAKIIAGIIVLAVMLSACNRNIVCPAYADKDATTEQKESSNS